MPQYKTITLPLQYHVTNITTQKILFNGPKGVESKKRYVVPNIAAFLEKMNLFTQEPAHPLQTDTIVNVYNLPSIGHAVQYIHAATGFPTKAKRIKAICKGN